MRADSTEGKNLGVTNLCTLYEQAVKACTYRPFYGEQQPT